ncbi:MAG: hypothetical protein M0037_00165 [Betaproteobacteria bacterium]|nr:hypothetical protein [Betaproteobacteria bacterium]
MKHVTTLVAAALFAAAGVASANPVALSNAQMDQVSAGATALASAGALTLGDLISASEASTTTTAIAGLSASAAAQSMAAAASVYFTPAVAGSAAQAAASLP